ncbi:MAG TPA: hypothetical protein VJA23_05010 [Candidatus Nanoarchaeia archaeon]|nr:hypothetical protein [Candidatus Nanoarchaeia archaeon]
MTHHSLEPVHFSWVDIMACTYCRHYIIVGTHAAREFCQNRESPFYDPSSPDYTGTDLTTMQALSGCEKLLFNGNKILPGVFKSVPQDSRLRKLPLLEVVVGYSAEMDLSTTETVAELTRKQQAQYDKLLKILKTVDGQISTEELAKRMQSNR